MLIALTTTNLHKS